MRQDADYMRGMQMVRPPKGGLGAAPSSEHRYFEITAAEGSSPPYLYSASEVEWSSSTHAFGAKSGGATITSDLRSIQEQSGYPYAGKIPVGAVVDAWLEGTDWLCEVVYYRGVYPG